MKIILQFALIVFGSIPLFGSTAEKELLLKFSLYDTTVNDLVSHLRSKHKISISFENYPVTWDQGITYREVLEEYTSRPATSMTEREKKWLRNAQEVEAARPNDLDITFHYYQKRFDFIMENENTVSSILQNMVALDDRYRFLKNGDRHLIVPVENHYNRHNSLILDNVPIKKLPRTLQDQVLAGNSLTFKISSRGYGPHWHNSNASVTVKIIESDLYDLLEVLCSSLSKSTDRNIIWSIGGYNTGRHLTFISISSNKSE